MVIYVPMPNSGRVRKLVYYGTIKPQTMVIAYTGHNIPILAELHKNE